MRVLFLGQQDSPLILYLRSIGEEVIVRSDALTKEFLDCHNPDFLVSYNYWPIIKSFVLERYEDRIINLHISFLPWNRGLSPNFWSHYENTPKGVTIHHVNEGIDTGDIIVQKEVQFSPDDTLATSYSKLHQEIQALFKEHWSKIKTGKCDKIKQQKNSGSYHTKKDMLEAKHLIEKEGWNTLISKLNRK